MSFMDRFKQGVEKAREGASDLAQIAKMKVEITRLNGQRAEATSELGRQVYALHGQGRTLSEVEATCRQIRHFDDQIKELEAEIGRIQQGTTAAPLAPGTQAAAPTTTAQAVATLSGQQESHESRS